MEQFLVVIRGAPASGKTTIAKMMRNFGEKVVWLKVDNFKDFFSSDASLAEQEYVDKCALTTLEYLLDEGFSVVMEKIFYNPFVIPLATEVAQEKGIKTKVFQIKCPLEVLQERDRNRAGVKEGCRKLMDKEIIKDIYEQLERTYYSGAIGLDTGNFSPEDCVRKIKEELEKD